MFEHEIIQQADRIKPLMRDFAIRHMDGILASCTEAPEGERWNKAVEIVDACLQGRELHWMANRVISEKLIQILSTRPATFGQAAEWAGNEAEWDHGFTARHVGRMVWDYCYQAAQHRNMIPWRINMH